MASERVEYPRMTTRTHQYLQASALLAAAIAIAAFALSASAASPEKITNCNKAASKPKTLTLTCGDGNTYLKNLSWSSFGGSAAQGKGTFVIDLCKPNCAQGKSASYPASAKATGSRACKGGLHVYRKLTLTFTGRKPASSKRLSSWTMLCPIG
jgi:hypothetical protein